MYIKITDVNKTIKKAPILRDINLEFTGGKVYVKKETEAAPGKTLSTPNATSPNCPFRSNTTSPDSHIPLLLPE